MSPQGMGVPPPGGVCVTVGVGLAVRVGVGVLVTVGLAVIVGVGVTVLVGVAVNVGVAVSVGVGVTVGVGVSVGVAVAPVVSSLSKVTVRSPGATASVVEGLKKMVQHVLAGMLAATPVNVQLLLPAPMVQRVVSLVPPVNASAHA